MSWCIEAGHIVTRSNAALTNHGVFDEPRPHRVLRIVQGRVPIAEIICLAPVGPSALPHWPYWVQLADLLPMEGPA